MLGKEENDNANSYIVDYGDLIYPDFRNIDHLYLNYLREKVGKRIDSGKKSYSNNHSWFITLNPFVDDLPKLRMIFNKILKKNYINTCIYAFEQRGETAETIKGYHVHGLFTFSQKKSKSKILREFLSTSKTICKKESIDVKKIFNEKNYNKILNYIKGNKSSDKMLKSKIDSIFRTRNDLLPLYEYHKPQKVSVTG